MTSLIGGKRVEKFHPRIEAYGTIDELNSFLGLLRIEINQVYNTKINDSAEKMKKMRTFQFDWQSIEESTIWLEMCHILIDVQKHLFTVGAFLAKEPTADGTQSESGITDADVSEIEKAIDEIAKELPPLKSFVVPGSSRASALAHVCRTVCRRAERAMLRLLVGEGANEGVAEVATENLVVSNAEIYINRLSDLLFVMSRRLSILQKGAEFFVEDA